MGKHDSDESLGFFLGRTEKVKGESLWILRNFKVILMIALIPAIGFGAYYLTKYLSNNKKPKTTPTFSTIANVTDVGENEISEEKYIGGYEVLGQIKINDVGVNVKILNPKIDDDSYFDDSLKYGAIYYYGEELDEIGNTVILGHNTSDSFLGLKELEIDDTIEITNKQGDITNYTVIEKTYCEPDDFSKFIPMEDNSREITLITCESEGTQRLVIKAIAK